MPRKILSAQRWQSKLHQESSFAVKQCKADFADVLNRSQSIQIYSSELHSAANLCERFVLGKQLGNIQEIAEKALKLRASTVFLYCNILYLLTADVIESRLQVGTFGCDMFHDI